MSSDVLLEPSATALVGIDTQTRLAAAMRDAERARCVRNIGVLIDAARLFGLPVLVTEQYPEGLGPTVPALRERLDAFDEPPPVVAKQEFDATSNGEFTEALDHVQTRSGDGAIRTVLVCGMEAHVCVYQTTRGLLGGGYHVHVAWDATCSRDPAHLETAQTLWRRCGALVTTAETVVFDLLGTAAHPHFKPISKMLR